MSRLGLLLAVLTLAGCAAPRRTAGADADVRQRLSSVKSDPAAVVAFVDERVASVSDPRLRAELDLARAQAMRALGRPLSAKSGLARAWAQVQPDLTGVGAAIQLEWADLEYRTGARSSARARWETLATTPRAPRLEVDRALACLAVSSAAAGDTAGEHAWSRRLGSRAAAAMAEARRSLGSERPPTSVASAPGGSIPKDPRNILAEIHTRSDWGARPTKSNSSPMEPIRAVTVHHAAMDRPAPGRASSQIRSIQSAHQNDEGWADIGYHFLVDPEGGIWEGRPLNTQGAHAGDSESNRGNIGVCLLGNFDLSSVPSSQAAALERLLDRLRDHFRLTRSDVVPHSRYRSTACPGRSLSNLVDVYRRG